MLAPASWLIAASEQCYRLLLYAYPSRFRHTYGGEMQQVFRTCCHVAYRQRGWRGVLTVWMYTISDLVTSALVERIAQWRWIMQRPERSSTDAFGERLAQVLGADPTAYRIFVTPHPTPRMQEVIDSLALDGDPAVPEATLTLFQQLSDGDADAQAERWLGGLRDAAQRSAGALWSADAHSLAERLVQLVYADPALYNVVAAAEPGYGLVELIESLALESDVADVETVVNLLRHLSHVDATSATMPPPSLSSQIR